VSLDLLDPAVDAILDALGDRTRRLILQRLGSGPQPVVDIAEGMPVSRPAISQHLRVLKEAGLVMDRPDGNRRIYSVDPEGLAELRRALEGFWGVALGRFAALANDADRDGAET
jgi:DNA-binding transcriptional ArsR family regulator